MKNKSQSSDKKLKQARLPFKTLSPRSPGIDQASAAKKRKLSNSQDSENVVRKVFVKENIDNSNDVEIISDNETVVEDSALVVKSDNLNPVVYLVDNVKELIQESKPVDSNFEEVIDLSDNSNSSKEDSFAVLNSEECSEDALNDDSNSEFKTPQKASASAEVTNNPVVVESSENDSASNTKTLDTKTPTQIKKTPKQLQKQQESAKKKEEKERARLERERLRLEEKEQRVKQKLEKDEQKRKEREEKEEQRRKEKEEKEEQRRKEKEEKEKKRLAEIEMKNEERRLKEEDKRKKEELKEEERKKRDLLREEKLKREKLEKEEAEQKQKKAAAAFVNFFVPKKSNADNNEDSVINPEDNEAEKDKLNFMPFSLKADMRLAPIIRHSLNTNSKKRLDDILNSEAVNEQLYTTAIKDPKYTIGKSTKTWESCEKDVVVIEEGEAIVESYTPKQHNRPKLLQFHENRRPPYWGTWTKTSGSVGPRTPFGKDKILDYEVDSDSEWEEEEPGESLNGSDDEKEKEESEDEYEVDNDFFVPHGYLSDEEQDIAEEIDSSSPETLKVKLKILQTEFNEEMKKKTEKIKPRLFGCIWSNADGTKPEKCVDTIWSMLKQNAMIYEAPIILAPMANDNQIESETSGPGAKLSKLPEILLPDLIKLTHGNEYSRNFLIKEFYAYVLKQHQDIQKQDISKSAIGRKIHEIAKYTTVKDEASGTSKRCWFVVQSTRDDCKLTDLPLENAWIYTLKHRKSEKDCDDLEVKKKTITPSHISKFTKTLSEDDRKKQFDVPKLEVKTDSTSIVKKRVALTSVPIGSKFPVKSACSSPAPKPVANFDENKPSTSSKGLTTKPKSRVNLLSSFIKRTEEKFSNPNMLENVNSAGTETETSEIQSVKKNQFIQKAKMDIDDCIQLSD